MCFWALCTNYFWVTFFTLPVFFNEQGSTSMVSVKKTLAFCGFRVRMGVFFEGQALQIEKGSGDRDPTVLGLCNRRFIWLEVNSGLGTLRRLFTFFISRQNFFQICLGVWFGKSGHHLQPEILCYNFHKLFFRAEPLETDRYTA